MAGVVARAWVVGLVALSVGCGAAESPCASAVTKGPWVERVDDTHAAVIWESVSRGCVEVAVAPESPPAVERVTKGAATDTHVVLDYGGALGLPLPDLPGTYDRNEVALADLQPGTCYHYRVRASGTKAVPAALLNGRFCTARAAASDLTFHAIGDTNPILGHTTPTLGFTLAAHPDFTLHLGDMQYYSSIAETWAYWFGAMAPLLRAGAIFPSIGNHEDEIASEFDDYYDRLFVPASVDATLTNYYTFTSAGVHFFALDSERSPLTDGSPQVTWLAGALAAAQAAPGFRFSVVYFHRPLYTLGDSNPQLAARAVLEPLFVAGGVKLVLQGHMHGYERFEVPNGITYVTCAGGGGVIANPSANVANYPDDAPLRVVVSDHYHACLYAVSAGHLTSTVIDEYGATIDQFDKVVP